MTDTDRTPVFVLKRDVQVAADPERGLDSTAIITLGGGTHLDAIPEYELRQLAPDHFEDADEVEVEEPDVIEADGSPRRRVVRHRASDAVPDDWRDDSARKRDAEQEAGNRELRPQRKDGT
jgi:hypothetical protein